MTKRIPSAYSSVNSSKMPVLFQVLSPDFETLLLPEALFMHVNPASLDFSYQKNVARFQTRGGFVEQHFGEQLTEISASASTGAFVNVDTGLAVHNKQETIAYHKMENLIDLYKSNGSVYDEDGTIQFRGRIRLVFGAGIYDGFFTSLTVNEAEASPFHLLITWSFKVEKEAYSLIY